MDDKVNQSRELKLLNYPKLFSHYWSTFRDQALNNKGLNVTKFIPIDESKEVQRRIKRKKKKGEKLCIFYYVYCYMQNREIYKIHCGPSMGRGKENRKRPKNEEEAESIEVDGESREKVVIHF